MRILYVVFLCFIHLTAFSQNERFKSLFVYNFTKNIEWPSDYQRGPFVITILGNSTLFPELQQNVRGKQVGSQTIQVTQAANIFGIEKCNILYIPAQQSSLLDAAKKQLAGKPTVIITEKTGTMKQGADINIIQVDGKLQFEINAQQISSKELKASKALLNLGIVYNSGATRGVPKLESVDDASIPR